ncbi:hypothetical protein SVAN01_05078 [Stagonosporopsis vannaccii]|nr:hypothetical protein SVAN01_05078 [Stagonosporopsis vannaccii]
MFPIQAVCTPTHVLQVPETYAAYGEKLDSQSCVTETSSHNSNTRPHTTLIQLLKHPASLHHTKLHTMSSSNDLPYGDPMILFARATIRYTRAELRFLNARINFIEAWVGELRLFEPRDEERYFEEWLAVKRMQIDHETQWFFCIVWQMWAQAYREVRPLD